MADSNETRFDANPPGWEADDEIWLLIVNFVMMFVTYKSVDGKQKISSKHHWSKGSGALGAQLHIYICPLDLKNAAVMQFDVEIFAFIPQSKIWAKKAEFEQAEKKCMKLTSEEIDAFRKPLWLKYPDLSVRQRVAGATSSCILVFVQKATHPTLGSPAESEAAAPMDQDEDVQMVKQEIKMTPGPAKGAPPKKKIGRKPGQSVPAGPAAPLNASGQKSLELTYLVRCLQLPFQRFVCAFCSAKSSLSCPSCGLAWAASPTSSTVGLVAAEARPQRLRWHFSPGRVRMVSAALLRQQHMCMHLLWCRR
jgi:hypothetical protein